jgi:hypothetical protein
MAIRDVLALLSELERDGIVARYAIGGAVAATRYTSPAATEDVDVFISFADGATSGLDPLRPIYAYLLARGARPEGGHVVIGDWPVQFLPAERPLLAEALHHAVEQDVDGITTRLFTAEHLAAIALQLGRPKDKLRLEQMVREQVLDMKVFGAILERHDLGPKWKDFSRRYLEAP